jgi:hypothetical protein
VTNQEPFARFIRSVEAIREEGQAEAPLVRAVAGALAELLEEHAWLRPEHMQGFPIATVSTSCTWLPTELSAWLPSFGFPLRRPPSTTT